MEEKNLFALAKELGELCLKNSLTLAFAESCTGGLLGKVVTDLPGSSTWFLGSVVTYSNVAKTNLLGVDARSIERNGAVSETVAAEMALGAKRMFLADVTLSTTGIAGPTGGTLEKAVGTVCFGIVDVQNNVLTTTQYFASGRAYIRQQAALFGLHQVSSLVDR